MKHWGLLVRAAIQYNINPKYKRNTNNGEAMVCVITSKYFPFGYKFFDDDTFMSDVKDSK